MWEASGWEIGGGRWGGGVACRRGQRKGVTGGGWLVGGEGEG